MKKFHYFGYASNLDVSTLKGRLKKEPVLLGLGVLPSYGFRFNFENPDGSARANLVKSENESVYGLIFEINQEDFDFFLLSEPGYDFVQVEVFSQKGEMKAYTFISSDCKENIFPKKGYLETILKGGRANGIPNGYLAGIINRAGPIQ
ncbi:gamma-glutamylcyclotransferase family protein [Rhodonellum sp.]|uniref:gamma-glutamylcyclotransferase family protein n=1 Tax=Rhodonellum sp. TaxID=2231180 RepID=UPI0027235226|nr:gamma-glutamylcyclotransferase family protein [Rhodonellum sp.]MDO9552671.1 gamma-glutamylcyclotransferase family protein [Rhodonellum sp.]